LYFHAFSDLSRAAGGSFPDHVVLDAFSIFWVNEVPVLFVFVML